MAIQDILAEGLKAQQSGNLLRARTLFLQALALAPQDVVCLYSLASIESQFGQYPAALSYVDRAIAANPAFAPSFLARSIIAMRLGNAQGALRDAQEAQRLDANLSGVAEQRALAEAAVSQGQQPEAGTLEALNQLNVQALRAQETGQNDIAKTLFTRALYLDPRNFIALYSLGVLASQQGPLDDAIDYLSKAVQAAPTSAIGHFALATALQQAGLLDDALSHFQRAIALDPAYTAAYTNQANLLHSMNRQKDALLVLEAALQHQPNDTKLLGNKGYILTEFKENALAAQTFSRLLSLDPDYDYALGLYAFAKMHAADWDDFDTSRQKILQRLSQGHRAINPLALAAISDSVQAAYQAAQIFGSHRFPMAKESLWKGEGYRHRRTRVAFLSADFREHPVGYLLIGLIENLRNEGLETYGISLGIRDGSSLYQRYRCAFDHYLDFADRPSIEVARALRALEIDIAIDLSGYTSGSRIDILSHRPAPIQATYLGFPGTVGLPYIDYLIGDEVITPVEYAEHYHEEVLRLPFCYLPRDSSVVPSAEVQSRTAHGLPESGVVFCSFNHSFKISPAVFSAWMQLLKDTPGSVLWLMKVHDEVRTNLLKAAAGLGVDPARIVWASRVPKIEDHLARYRCADVFLDTFPYNGHTTVSDALYAGLPVVTLMGEGFASRVGSSLLRDLGLANWSCRTLADYLQTAKVLASNASVARTMLTDQRQKTQWPPSPARQAQEFARLLKAMQVSRPVQ